jgi:hypothetical protein
MQWGESGRVYELLNVRGTKDLLLNVRDEAGTWHTQAVVSTSRFMDRPPVSFKEFRGVVTRFMDQANE